MSKIKVVIPEEKFEMEVELLTSEAPKTCSALQKILPIEAKLIHAMLSGNEVLIELPEKNKLGLDPENWVYHVIPGDVLYWYSHWGQAKYLRDNPEIDEIVFIYDRYTKLRDISHHETAANLFGRISSDSKLIKFAEICRRIRKEGPKIVKLEKA
ncbi:MAG: DUF3830 family protein [Crenarchaeota archaeon]|nr:DUF3830 family protein [Thermoproteota archaeon]